MSNINQNNVGQLIAIATRAWNISAVSPGGALGKVPRVEIAITDPSAGNVTVTVYCTSVTDGTPTSGQMSNSQAASATYTPTTPGGVPFDGPAASARAGAVQNCIASLASTLIAVIVANGGTYP